MQRSWLLIASAALAVSGALGHGNIVEPEAVWVGTYADSGFIAELDGPAVFGKVDNQKYGYGQAGNIKAFADAFPKSKYKSIKDLIMDKQKMLTGYKATPECGNTIKDDTKRAELGSEIKFSALGHGGPCEIWCDNTKVLYELDCQTKFGERNTVIPFDNTKCKGADKFAFYWLGMTGDPWQVYINCLWLKGASGGGASGSAPAAGSTSAPRNTSSPASAAPAPQPATATPPAAAPKPATQAPKPTTQAPKLTTQAPKLTTQAPVAGEASLAPSTNAPAKNCKRRARRD